ncbi:MAG TPA: pilus assembly protein N-terminal domain-containing protein [Polyangiaceae bacterium]|nr:pilus assembly protein N-terminal domain-containing protein [Polyangiaceae bacterium]
MSIRRWLFRALSLAVAISFASTQAIAEGTKAHDVADAGGDVTLAIGETRTISARDVKNYSEGVAGIIDVKLTSDASQFVLVGRKPGSTTLLLIRSDGTQTLLNVHVFVRSPEAVERELGQLLEGLKVQSRRVGAQILLDGIVTSEADLKRVQQIAEFYPGQVISLVQLAQPGVLASSRATTRYLIRIDFYFVQYDKNSSYAVGLGWPESIGAAATGELSYDFLAGTTRSATATVAKQPLPHLDVASRRGWAKVLKQATVITNNDAEANFSNGGEQNFPINTGLTIGVQRVQFGTELTVLPHYDPEKRELGLKLVAQVSDLTAAASGTPLPSRTLSNLTTTVSLKLGQSLVLSGIRSQTLTHNVAGLPGLSAIPVLGLLFGSHSESDLATEGAIFVVPSVVQSIPNTASELVSLALRKFESYDGKIDTVGAYDKRPAGGVGIPTSTPPQ